MEKVLGDNVFNNIEKVYNLRPEIVMSKKDFENVTESKEILQFSELFQTGFGENVKYQLKIGEKGAFVSIDFLITLLSSGLRYLMNKKSMNALWIVILIILFVRSVKFQWVR